MPFNINIYQILLLLAVAAAIVFLVLYIQSRRAYKKLLKMNLQEKEETFTFSEKKVFLDPSITIKELARKMGTNRATLSHIVNQYFHKTFPALLNQYRVNEALRLLTDSETRDWKLEVIGEMCGYRNRQVFHSAFKRETGITPNHFRKISEA